ncbi:uncharacterized protein LOC129572890, partial [Sitodiplosis mosellana]|uniref:uncharacterized protein LOC129572890 n=1 Tax=Sitodiplosis mosellana TaxID=263140 RepID=UPI002444B19F
MPPMTPMPRYYANKGSSIDFDALLEGIKDVKINKHSIRSVADRMGISHNTLTRYVKILDEANLDVSSVDDKVLVEFLAGNATPGKKPIFTAAQEKALMNYLITASNVYYGLSIAELKRLAYQFAKLIEAKYPAAWDENKQASSDWYYAFMNRHKNLSLRTPEQTSINRAKSFNKENVDAFYKNLSTVMSANNYEPHRIWNMDEAGFPTVPHKTVKTVAQKGKKRVGTATSAERGTNVSMALSISASGQTIPAFYLFPRKKMSATYMTHASSDAVGFANGSGYMTSAEFNTYMDHFIKFSGAQKGSPTLLLLDNHTSHLSVEAIDKAIKHDITMLSFPPHCTHRMQPLDVSVFGPMKIMYTKKCQEWKNSNATVAFDLHHVPLIADQCLDLCATRKNIKSAFQTTGVYPLNSNTFTEVDFLAAKFSGESQSFEEEENDVDEEDRRRIVVLSAENVGAHEEVSTSEASEVASTSGTTSMGTISAADLRDALNAVGPVKKGTPAKKSNRGPKPMTTAILTSPEVVEKLQKKADTK